MRYYHTPIRIVVNVKKKKKYCSTKCWYERSRETGSPIRYWWQSKMVEPLWKIVWQFYIKLNTFAIQHNIYIPGHLSQRNVNLSPHKNLYTNVQRKFICISQRLEQPKFPSTIEWLNKLWHIHTMEYYSAMQRSRLWSCATSRKDLEGIILTGHSQSLKVM